MTTSVEPNETVARPARGPLPWYLNGLANLAVITALSLASWYLLVDPQWSPFGLYPQPFLAFLFWALLTVVWIGFNLEFHGFDGFRQPVRGLLLIGITSVIAAAITIALTFGWGSIDPTFAPGRADGTGYLTGALWVLFGFFFYVMSVVNWGNWPWASLQLRQPWLGLGQISLLLLPITVAYLVLAVPGLATWADPGTAWLDTNTLIGWFYSIIVSVVITGLLTENWPWRLAGSPAQVALASTAGNVLLGTGIFLLFRPLTEALLGSVNTDGVGAAITGFPAQLGVCWVFWMIMWSNCFGNKPTGLTAAANYAARVVITLALAVGTFLFYYFFAAGSVLHEPALTDQISGNALGWVDWWALWALFYVLCFQSWGLPQPAALGSDPR